MFIRAAEVSNALLRDTDNIMFVDPERNILDSCPTFRAAGSSSQALPQPLELIVDDSNEIEPMKNRIFDVWGIPVESRPKKG